MDLSCSRVLFRWLIYDRQMWYTVWHLYICQKKKIYILYWAFGSKGNPFYAYEKLRKQRYFNDNCFLKRMWLSEIPRTLNPFETWIQYFYWLGGEGILSNSYRRVLSSLWSDRQPATCFPRITQSCFIAFMFGEYDGHSLRLSMKNKPIIKWACYDLQFSFTNMKSSAIAAV